MPAIIDSAPHCITSVRGALPADDSADFVIQAAYQKCAGFMTFGPGTVYGQDGAAASTAYYVLTWIGIIFMVVVLVGWVIYENRSLTGYVAGLRAADRAATPTAPDQPTR
jgi:hypothetical protein